MRNIIGIDFSINFPTLCIWYDGTCNFISFMRKKEIKGRTKKCKEFLSTMANFKFIELDDMTDNEYSESQTTRLFDAIKIAESVVNELNKYDFDRNKTIVCIEGFSYASNSSRLAEMSGYQYLLRFFLHINGYSFDIVSPKTVKKFAGKGNFNKKDMLREFLNFAYIQEKFPQLLNAPDNLLITKEIPNKPFEDIIDSFWICEMTRTKKS